MAPKNVGIVIVYEVVYCALSWYLHVAQLYNLSVSLLLAFFHQELGKPDQVYTVQYTFVQCTLCRVHTEYSTYWLAEQGTCGARTLPSDLRSNNSL